MKRCQACYQPIKSSKKPTVNYTIFSSRCAGIDMVGMMAAGERWKDRHYMEKYKMYPYQIEVTPR